MALTGGEESYLLADYSGSAVKNSCGALDLGHPSVVGSGALCPSAMGWLQRITTPHRGFDLIVIFGSFCHTN